MDFQVLLIAAVVILTILDAIGKRARKRAQQMPPGQEEEARPGLDPLPGEEGPAPRRTPDAPRMPQAPPRPHAPPKPATARTSALDILVPPEIRKELEDLIRGDAPEPEPDRRPPAKPLPAPGTDSASAASELPVEARSREPRSTEPRRATREPVQRPDSHRLLPDLPPGSDASGAGVGDAPRKPAPPPGAGGRFGLGTLGGLRDAVVAREVLGPPVALRDDETKRLGARAP